MNLQRLTNLLCSYRGPYTESQERLQPRDLQLCHRRDLRCLVEQGEDGAGLLGGPGGGGGEGALRAEAGAHAELQSARELCTYG